jgi:hypothetical protein
VDPVYTVKIFPVIYYIHIFTSLKANVLYTDLYHIYSLIKYKYFGVTEERDALAVVHQCRLDHHLPFSDLLEAPQISFSNNKGGLFALLNTSPPAEPGSKAAALQ